jgi:hypothetical protein
MGETKAPRKIPAVTRENIELVLARFRACMTIEQVNLAAKEASHFVQEVSESPRHAVRAQHIKNLAAYRRQQIREGLHR